MNADDVVGPRERLVEVLLEESLRASRADGESRRADAPDRRPWLAAAVVLLGTGVVVATSLLRRPDAAEMASAQDPSPPPRVASWHRNVLPVASQADWDAVKARVSHIRLRLVRTGEDGRMEEIEAGSAFVPGNAVREFVGLVPAVGDRAFDVAAVESPRFDAHLSFEADGMRVHGFVRLWDQPTLVLGSRRATSLPDGLRQELLKMHAAAERRLHVASGLVTTLGELEAVPQATKAIRCPPLPKGSLQRHLGRFQQLEHLEFVVDATRDVGQSISIQLPEVPTTLFEELQVLPTLRHLRCCGALLDSDDRVRELAALPQLTSLRLDGVDAGVLGGTRGVGVRLGGVTVLGMRLLARKLTALELGNCEVPPALLEPWLEAAQLRRLALSGNTVLPPELLARFARLPTLEELELAGHGWTDAHLQALAGSRLTRLRLGHTAVTVAGMEQLPRTLRLIDLRRIDPASPTLQVLLQPLRRLHPGCRVLGPGDQDPNDVDPFPSTGTTRR